MDDREEVLDKKMISGQIIDEIYNDGTWESEGGNIMLHSRGDLASVIVGAVMKKTMADLLSVDERIIVKDPAISGLYPSPSLTCISVDKLDLCAVEKKRKSKGEKSSYNSNLNKNMDTTLSTDDEASQVVTPRPSDKSKSKRASSAVKDKSENKSEKVETSTEKLAPTPTPKPKEPVHIKWDKPVHKPAEEESDADSLLDSDEDFEERDTHFRRNKVN